MTEENQQAQQPQEPVILNLTLSLEQVNAVIGALGKLPTEAGVWPLRQFIINQAQQQLVPPQEPAPAAE